MALTLLHKYPSKFCTVLDFLIKKIIINVFFEPALPFVLNISDTEGGLGPICRLINSQIISVILLAQGEIHRLALKTPQSYTDWLPFID